MPPKSQKIKITISGPKKSGRSSIARLVEASLRPYLKKNLVVNDDKEMYVFDAEKNIRQMDPMPKVTLEVK